MTRDRAGRPDEALRSTLRLRALLGEAMAGMLAKPARAGLTALGTLLGVGACVVVLGLTATAGGQISKRFTALAATEVVVEDHGIADPGSDPGLSAPTFPADADARVGAIDGVVAAGVWWPVHPGRDLTVSGVVLPGNQPAAGVSVVAASPGLLRAVHAVVAGRLYDRVHDERAEHVALLGATAAALLGFNAEIFAPAALTNSQALTESVLIDGVPFVVLGLIDNVARHPDLLLSVVVPAHAAETLWGAPSGDGIRASMLIDTRLGAAAMVANQAPVALRADAPEAFKVIVPPDPRSLRDAVNGDLAVLFLLLAGVCLVIGAVGIANTTMVAVLERVAEIGLRRALGARRHHIAAQFLVESAALGTVGGVLGTSLGVICVVAASFRHWTAILPPFAVLPAPFIGALIGTAAGLYPALRAAAIEPADALRR